MTDLAELLDRATGSETGPAPVADDLARGRAAVRRQRRRRAVTGVAAACAIGVLAGLAGPALLDRDQGGNGTVSEQPTSESDDLLFAANETAGPYTFGKLPTGWEVQGGYPQGVTIARIGDPDQEPYSFVGKLVIMYDRNPLSGDATVVDGREFYTGTGEDHATVAVATRPDEPEGVVRVQYPTSAGWDVATMIEFLDAVTVGSGAQPGLG